MSIDATAEARASATDRSGTVTTRRTTAMWVVLISGLLELLMMVRVMLAIGPIPPLVVFSVLLVITSCLVVFIRRPWAYLVGGIAVGLVMSFNFPHIADSFSKPVATGHQGDGIIAITAGIVGLVAGIAAFVEGRRGRDAVPAFRAPVGEALAILVAGALVGAFYVSNVGYLEVQSSSGAGVHNGVQVAPTQAPVELTAKDSAFAQHALSLRSGGGTVYVVNQDGSAHTFDIDVKGKHYSYPVPPSSTIAVVLNFDAGTYTYYCAISGHRGNGMEGKLTAT